MTIREAFGDVGRYEVALTGHSGCMLIWWVG